MVIVIDPTTGHVNPHSIVWQKEENILGLFHPIITVEDKDLIAIEQIADASPSARPFELFVGDTVVFAHNKQYADAAKASGQVIVEGAKLYSPDVADCITETIELVEAIKTKNWPVVEQQLIAIGEEIFKLAPQLMVTIAKKA